MADVSGYCWRLPVQHFLRGRGAPRRHLAELHLVDLHPHQRLPVRLAGRASSMAWTLSPPPCADGTRASGSPDLRNARAGSRAARPRRWVGQAAVHRTTLRLPVCSPGTAGSGSARYLVKLHRDAVPGRLGADRDGPGPAQSAPGAATLAVTVLPGLASAGLTSRYSQVKSSLSCTWRPVGQGDPGAGAASASRGKGRGQIQQSGRGASWAKDSVRDKEAAV